MLNKFDFKKYIISFMYNLISLVIAIGVLSVIAVVISNALHTSLVTTFFWTGILSGMIGVLSLIRGVEEISENNNFSQVLGMNFKSQEDMAQNYFRLRDSSIGFMFFMMLVGAGLVLISLVL